MIVVTVDYTAQETTGVFANGNTYCISLLDPRGRVVHQSFAPSRALALQGLVNYGFSVTDNGVAVQG